MRPQDNEQNAGRCICPECPTYNDCMDGNDERLFCARGKTSCDPTPNGCICGSCPVWSENQLSSYYFCREGAAS